MKSLDGLDDNAIAMIDWALLDPEAGLVDAELVYGSHPPSPEQPIALHGRGVQPPEPPPDTPTLDELAAFDLTDLGNAKRLAARFGADLHWCEERLSWLVWNGLHWDWDLARRVHGWSHKTVEGLKIEAAFLFEQWQALNAANPEPDEEMHARLKHMKQRAQNAFGWAKASQASARITATANECRALTGVPVVTKDLDQQKWLLNTTNGTLDIESGSFREARRGDLITRALAVPYDPRARAPTWENVIETILPDEDVRNLVQRAFGYALTGDNGEQKWFLLTGEGSNGKSTILDAFRAILGPYATVLPKKLLEVQRVPQHETELMNLLGARFAVGSEPKKGSHWDAERIKALTGDATITARRMRENHVEFVCTAKLFVSANDLPKTDDLGHGFWRRLVVIPFVVKITEDKADPRLQEKLAGEGPGILNWALEGARAWLRGGLAVPEACRAEANKYRGEQDEVQRFVQSMCDVDPSAHEKSQALYDAYKAWHTAEGMDTRPMHRVGFGKSLHRLGFKSFEGANRVGRYLGLRLSSRTDAPMDDYVD